MKRTSEVNMFISIVLGWSVGHFIVHLMEDGEPQYILFAILGTCAAFLNIICRNEKYE